MSNAQAGKYTYLRRVADELTWLRGIEGQRFRPDHAYAPKLATQLIEIGALVAPATDCAAPEYTVAVITNEMIEKARTARNPFPKDVEEEL